MPIRESGLFDLHLECSPLKKESANRSDEEEFVDQSFYESSPIKDDKNVR